MLPLWAVVLIVSATSATATDFAIDPTNPNNGLWDIYSATFDPPLTPDGSFFGLPPSSRAIDVTPTPTGVEAVADTTLCVQNFLTSGTLVVPPCTTLYATPTPSSLDLTLSAGNTLLAINGGNAFFPGLTLVISGGTPNRTDIVAEGVSMINFAPSASDIFGNVGVGGTVPIDGNGVAVFEIDIAPATAVDFATFNEIVTDCTGNLCALIPILTLDMQRYRLIVDWDPSFSYFTAEFTGQTANNSIVFANLDSGVPDITANSPVIFGDIATGTTALRTVTVTNDGLADLVIGQIAQTDPIALPFSIPTDNCSLQTVAPGANCTIDIQFAPTTTFPFNPDSFDIPSNDPGPDEDPDTPDSITVEIQVSIDPIISVTQNVSFGDVIATTTGVEMVTITNIGTEDLILGQITQPGAPFNVVDTCSNMTLSPGGGDCTFDVRFTPTTAGAVPDDTFNIPSNDPNNSPVTVTVSGTGLPAAPDIFVSDPIPPEDDRLISFGQVTEATDWNRVITITNIGNINLNMGMIAQTDTLAEPFSILSDTCSGQIIAPAAGAIPPPSCTIEVRFLPSTTGPFNDSFDIPSDDPDEPTLTFNVDGTGVLVGTGTLSLEPEGASALKPATLLALQLYITDRLRRRYH